MRQDQYEARSAWIDRALARNAELRNHPSCAVHLAVFVLGFVIPCAATGAAIVWISILVAKTYLG